MNLLQTKQRRILLASIFFVGVFLIKVFKNLSLVDQVSEIVVLNLVTGVTGLIFFLFLILMHHFFSRSRPRLALTLDSIFFIMTFVLFLNVNMTFWLHNDEINSKLRNLINSQDQQIIQSFVDNNPKTMFEMFSKEAKKSGIESVNKFYSQLKNKITSKKLENYDQYLVSTDSGPNISILSENDEKFQMTVPWKSKKTFISLKRLTRINSELLISNVYVEENGEWKLFISHLGEVAMGGKTSYQWMEEAKKYYDEKSYIMSLMALELAKQISPAPFIEYRNKKEIDVLAAKNLNEIKTIKWPIVIDFIETRPQLIAVKAQLLKDVLYPRIYYVTKVPLTDPKKLQEEAERMKEFVISIFHGVDKDRSHLLFVAYNEIPNESKKTYKSYGIVVDLKK